MISKFFKTDNIKSNFFQNEKSAPRTTKRPAVPSTTKRSSRPQSSGNLPNLQVKKLIVQVGATGTDDDVTMQVIIFLRNNLQVIFSSTRSVTWQSAAPLASCHTP